MTFRQQFTYLALLVCAQTSTAWTNAPFSSKHGIQAQSLSSSSCRSLRPFLSSHASVPESLEPEEGSNAIGAQAQPTRREWMTLMVGQAALAPLVANAAPPSIVSTKAVCDPTVTVWKQPERNRLVYLLGTAHISKISAELSGQLVRDIHPSAVFVELDLKRVQGAAQYIKNQEEMKQSMLQVAADGAAGAAVPVSATTKQTSIVVPTIGVPSTENTAGGTTAVASSSSSSDNNNQRQGPLNGLRQRALNYGAQAVGNAVKGMYQNLGDQGFSPGEEFSAAILEAKNQGADVILGDRDVEVTLRRLTQALAATDFNKLNDDALQAKMADLMGSGKAMDLPPGGVMDAEYKEEFTQFVENMKSRQNVRAIMTELKEVAPALAQVMLTERDVYMATGLDTLNQFECIVAVMGIAHVDGVENNLRRQGWTEVKPMCPATA